MKKLQIAVVGSTNMDYVYQLKALPQKGETVIAEAMKKAGGGKGANQAVAVRRLGEKVLFVSALGKDYNGKFLAKNFESEGISLSGIEFFEGPTGNAVINVDHGGNNTIVVYSGANGLLEKKQIDRHEAELKKVQYIIVQLEIPIATVEYVIEKSKLWGNKVILNPAPAAELSDKTYEQLFMLTPNETELKLLTKEDDVQKGAWVLLQKGVENVVITLGEKGSFFVNKEREVMVETFSVKALDSTAAGDSFNAALAVALLKGGGIESCLKFANAAGALTATRFGAQEALPTIEEVETLAGRRE